MMTQLKPHKVLGRMIDGVDTHALSLEEGDFADIIFLYKNVSFDEDKENDKLKLRFEYEVIEVPEYRYGYDKIEFEAELGDFLVQLLFYGLEKDHLGFIDDNERSTDHLIKPHSQ